MRNRVLGVNILKSIWTVVKVGIQSIARKCGVELKRYRPANSDVAKMGFLLSHHKIDLVLDVGGNTGQFAEYVRTCGYKGRLVSFEPLSREYHEIEKKSKRDPLWSVAPRMAIGSEDGEVVINISKSSTSSSILPILPSQVKATPNADYIGRERVLLAKLDTASAPYIRDNNRIFLKIDTQGYEDKVLEGANGILPKVLGLQIELSLIPFYENQTLFLEMINKIYSIGYELHYLFPVYVDPQSGRLLQVDGIFLRDSSCSRC